MDLKILSDLRSRITRSIQARRINEAVNLLLTMASTTAASWAVTDRIERIRKAYEYMSGYALDGVPDPGRESVYAEIVRDINSLADSMMRDAKSRITSSLYFDTVRYASLHPETAPQTVIANLRKLTSELSLQSFAGSISPTQLLERERLEAALFRTTWTFYPFTKDGYDCLLEYMQDDTTPLHIKLLLISAILLGHLEYRDERRIELLSDLYMSESRLSSTELTMRALVALVIALWISRDQRISSAVRHKLEAAAELPSWHSDVKMVSLLLLRTRDTEKITRTLTEDVIPSMMKLRPDIYRKLSETEDADDPSSLSENPEWEELLKKSGLRDKLDQLGKLQEQGGDVMMATFAHLKTFPFFTEISNWFMPFHEDHSAVVSSRATFGSAITDMISASRFVCDNDRYSMLFAIGSIPENQRKMMIRQIEEQQEGMAEMFASDLAGSDNGREVHANNYIRDLYRFFKLFRRKGEFQDIFTGDFNPYSVPLLRESLSDSESMALIGEFFFHHGYWKDAIDVFSLMAEKEPPSSEFYQKSGYAYQKLGETQLALAQYEKAEMLAPSNKWTWRRIAGCLRVLGQPAKALEYYKRLAEARPDDLSTILQLANTMAEAGMYADAMKLFFKVEFLNPDSTKTLRPIAWTSFLSGDYATSRRYFNKVMANDPTPMDIINLGHLEMATGHYREAIEVYRRAIESPGGSKSLFAKTMQEDLKHLRKANIDDLVTGIVIDRILA